MATFPGFDFLSNFSGIFTFLFSFSLIYGILEVTHPFGDKKQNIHSIIALSLSVLLMFSKISTEPGEDIYPGA